MAEPSSQTPAKRRGRPPKLTREQILGAAYDLVRREGRDALTMRAVAEELGTGPMSLYTHVRDKAELLEGVAAQALEQIEVDEGSGENWQARLAAWAISLRSQLLAHPEALELLGKQHHGSPQLLRAVRGAIQNLRDAGFEVGPAAQAVDGLLWVSIGFASLEIAQRQQPRQETPGEQFSVALATMSDEERSEIASYLPFFATEDLDELYASVLRRFIAGLEGEETHDA